MQQLSMEDAAGIRARSAVTAALRPSSTAVTGSDLGRLHSALCGSLQSVKANGTAMTVNRLGSCPYKLLLTIRRLA